MKKTIACLLAVLLLCSALSGAALAAGEDLTGTWFMTDMDDGSGEDHSKELAAASALGMLPTLEIREDGTATITLFDETHDFTVDYETGEFVINDNRIKYTYKDDTLTFGDDSMFMIFSRQAPAVSAAESRVFDFYEFVGIKDEKGKDTNNFARVGDLVLFEDGKATLSAFGEDYVLTFDFEKGQYYESGVLIDEFTLADEVLTIRYGKNTASFKLGDPGYAGPYTITALIDANGTDMTEQLSLLAALNMMPTLSIAEDGTGTLEMAENKIELKFDFDKMLVSSPEDEEGEAIGFTYKNGTLTMENEGSTMTFRRVMPVAAEETPEEKPAA